ncbi:heterokaryon incompatibility protein-domain-containing protein, partial [Bisporella sp. PMI_857]
MDDNINLTRGSRESNRHSGSRPAFTYQAIDPAKREIRLLGIQGLAGDPSILRCQLKHFSLDNGTPHFVAISYTWGTSRRMGKLEINGKILRIPYNAWDILHELLYRSQLFWIDSVCIDQTNTKERNHQVSMMRDIYSSADMVYVWLGSGTPDTHLAMAKL